MTFLSLSNKLPPPRKAWEGFTSKLRLKIHKLKRSKAIIKKTTNRLNTTLFAVLNGSSSFPSRLAPTLRHRPRKQNPEHHSRKQKFSPVFADELFIAEPISVQGSTTVTVTEKSPADSTEAAAEMTMQQVTKVEVPELEGVDKRAEEFIKKFKEEMRLQSQKSFGEYQEMLARGS